MGLSMGRALPRIAPRQTAGTVVAPWGSVRSVNGGVGNEASSRSPHSSSRRTVAASADAVQPRTVAARSVAMSGAAAASDSHPGSTGTNRARQAAATAGLAIRTSDGPVRPACPSTPGAARLNAPDTSWCRQRWNARATSSAWTTWNGIGSRCDGPHDRVHREQPPGDEVADEQVADVAGGGSLEDEGGAETHDATRRLPFGQDVELSFLERLLPRVRRLRRAVRRPRLVDDLPGRRR